MASTAPTTPNTVGNASPTATSATASAATSAGPAPDIVVGIPIAPERVASVVNPKGEARYAGKTGTLRGTLRITGDPAPTLTVKLPDSKCRGEAAATHGKLFRVGQEGALADAMVAVTGYRGYVPASEPAKKLTISGCALSRRTLVTTFGQRVEIANLDAIESYMPYLDGAPYSAVIVAVPRGDAVKLYPMEPGRYMLRDQLPNPHLTADVFTLAYATHDVTGLDGKYEIKGIPVGEVSVDAFLPATQESVGKRLEIREGDNTLDLTLAYDRTKDPKAAAKKPAAPSASVSAAPPPKTSTSKRPGF